ncbi:hypothetical protein ACODT3_01425 [Streptomyces sp. 4.24]|uniref:hypothetical protein n=1 Tax=Streptomyces tritrimontium TaxID=3406573 RepID=UPI003BB5F8F1
MTVALWLMGMPFLQALTISTGVKIAVALLVLRRRPDLDSEPRENCRCSCGG